MKIPKSFRKAQLYFQDKTVFVHKAVIEKGSLGTKTSHPSGESVFSYKMNFKIISNIELANELGLQTGLDAVATVNKGSSLLEKIEKGDYLKYENVFYKIVEIQPHESYLKFICKAVK